MSLLPNEDVQIRTALAIIAEALLRMEYSKDCHHIRELEAIADKDLVKAMQIQEEKHGR